MTLFSPHKMQESSKFCCLLVVLQGLSCIHLLSKIFQLRCGATQLPTFRFRMLWCAPRFVIGINVVQSPCCKCNWPPARLTILSLSQRSHRLGSDAVPPDEPLSTLTKIAVLWYWRVCSSTLHHIPKTWVLTDAKCRPRVQILSRYQVLHFVYVIYLCTSYDSDNKH